MGSFTRCGLMLVVVALTAGCAGCTPNPAPVNGGSAGAAGATQSPSEVLYCEPACAKLVANGCAKASVCTRYAEPAPNCVEQIPCAQWCAQTMQAGAPSALVFKAKCIATVDTTSMKDVCAGINEWCNP